MSTPSFKYGNGVWATKEGSSLAYNDDNGNYKPLPFSVSRASSATRVNKQGLIEVVGNDRLRIDYSESANGVALLEPSRTNAVPYSEQFDNAAWVKQDVTVTANAAISPDGSQTADKIIPSSASTTHQIYDLSLISSQTCATSIFAKADGINTFQILDGSSAANGAFFNLSNGTFTNTGSGVGSMIYYGNGWYRCIVISTTTGYRIYCPSSSSNASGDGSSGVLLWGAQLEAGSYATSYIPTSGSTATRQADVANGAGVANVFNDSEGVLYANIAALVDDATFRFVTIVNGTQADNQVKIGYDNVASQLRIACRGTVGGTYVKQIPVANVLLNNKVALKYKANDFATWINGFEYEVQLSGTDMPSGMNNFRFEDGDGSNDFYGKAKAINVYQTALTDAELEYLTSYRSLAEMATELNLNAL